MAAATMQEIAEAAGVAKGTIYLYFRDRDELVERTFETAMEKLFVRADEALDREVPFEEKLRAVMTAQLEFFSENREFFRLYLSLRMPEGTPAQQRRQQRACHPRYRQRIDKLSAVIRQGIERGELRPIDPERLALFIIEGSTAVILDRLTEKAAPAESADVDLLVGLILDGIRKRS